MQRRQFLAYASAAVSTSMLTSPRMMVEASVVKKDQPHGAHNTPLRLPPKLEAGDTVGLFNPASAAFETMPTAMRVEALETLGFKVRKAPNHDARWGYFAGHDQQRADDINHLFADPEVRCIIGTGGWGSARVLPLLDYDLIRKHPKVVLGYSDVTALLLGIHAQTGLVTFHGPSPLRDWSWQWFEKVLMQGEAAVFANKTEKGDHLAQTQWRNRTITPGKASGPLVGGNLTVLSAIVGSTYLPDWRGKILFLEDVNGAVYRVDRMLTQLKLAGILDQLAGFVFGQCTRCDPDTSGYGSLTLEEVLDDHIAPLGIPAWQGAMIGHVGQQFTLPIGAPVHMDAQAGTLTMAAAAVQ